MSRVSASSLRGADAETFPDLTLCRRASAAATADPAISEDGNTVIHLTDAPSDWVDHYLLWHAAGHRTASSPAPQTSASVKSAAIFPLASRRGLKIVTFMPTRRSLLPAAAMMAVSSSQPSPPGMR
jgi:hypothetical protein